LPILASNGSIYPNRTARYFQNSRSRAARRHALLSSGLANLRPILSRRKVFEAWADSSLTI
jgi:hypothetical protein